ncbi:MAG: GNAT family N-acetyltransferase [Pseudomonadota bacterium]
MIVREARPGDAQAFADILNPLIDEGTSTAIEGHQRAEDWAWLARGDSQRTVCFVATDDEGRVLGFQYLEPARDTAQAASIASFARPDGGRRGVGAALFARTRGAAGHLGYAKIVAVIRADNVSGLAYYSKMGFHDTEVFRDVPMADGRPVDRIKKVFDL